MEVLIGIANQLEINKTFFIMFALFAATFFLVKKIALKDLTGLLVERSKRIEGREASTQQLKTELGSVQEKLAKEMARARLETSETFVLLRNKATQEHRAILTAARENASGEIKAERGKIAESEKVEMNKLSAEIPALAKLIVDQILNGKTALRGGKSRTAHSRDV